MPSRQLPSVQSGSPVSLLGRFAHEMDRLFEGFGVRSGFHYPRFLGRGRELLRRETGFVPAEWSPWIDIVEREGQLLIRADLPGLTKDDIKVEVTDDMLTIEGERKHETKEERVKGISTASAPTAHFTAPFPCRRAPRVRRRPLTSARACSRSPCQWPRSRCPKRSVWRSKRGSDARNLGSRNGANDEERHRIATRCAGRAGMGAEHRCSRNRRHGPRGDCHAHRDRENLHGETDSRADHLRVQGVKAIANDIEVELPGSHERTDADIARAAVDALRWRTSVPEGRIFARGTMDQ